MIYEPDPFFEASSVGPAVTFGADETPTHAEAQDQAKAEFLKKFGHAVPQSYEEANWLDERVKAIKAEVGVTKTVEVTTPTGEKRIVQLTQEHIDKGFWGGMSTGGKIAIAGGVGLGALGLVMLRRRRKNPRRKALLPIIAVGGLAALLFWGGKKTVEAVETVVPAP